MPQLVFGVCQNPKEEGFNTSERIDLPVKARASTQSESFLLPCSLCMLPPKGVAQTKDDSSPFKISG